MPVSFRYQWDSIAPGTTASVWVHGFSVTEIPVYVAVPNVFELLSFGATAPPLPQFNLTQGEFGIHVDGSIARLAAVEQLPISQSSVGALLYVLYDYYSS